MLCVVRKDVRNNIETIKEVVKNYREAEIALNVLIRYDLACLSVKNENIKYDFRLEVDDDVDADIIILDSYSNPTKIYEYKIKKAKITAV